MPQKPGIPTTALAAEHTPEAIAQRLRDATRHSYLGDFVLGAIDGTVTTFAIVAGVAGAGLSGGVAMILGLANVFADGFSMAASNYLKSRADAQVVQSYRAMEEGHIDQIPDGEREEIRQIFANKGFEGTVLDEIVTVITHDRKQWVDTMLTEEWGLQLQPPSPHRAALSTFAAFLLAGMVPLIPLFFSHLLTPEQTFRTSAVAALVTFFLIGYARGRITGRQPWLAALETLFIGGTAALLAYLVGMALNPESHEIVGVNILSTL